MSEKHCSKCKELKPFSEYSPNKFGTSGKQSQCKVCRKKATKMSKRTKYGFLGKIYATQRANSMRRNHPMPEYSLAELRAWALERPEFHELFEKWVSSNYDRWKAPSVDRRDDYKPYTIDNLLRICTFKENCERAHSDMKNGINNKESKAVIQMTLVGNFIAEYYSMSQAARITGLYIGNISRCCNGTRNKTGGYKWKFA